MSLALKKHKRATVGLGTIIEITLWLPEQQDPSHAFKQAYHVISDIHAKMSVHDDVSDLGRYRLAQPHASVEMSADTMRVLHFSETLFTLSHGYFDVCIGNMLAKASFLPTTFITSLSAKQRNQPLLLEQTTANGDGIVKKVPDTMIDLGGVAKGYAVDCAIDMLQALHVPAALINAGGDMRIYGDVAAPIHIRKNKQYNFLKDLKNRALASSGMPTNHHDHALPIVNPFLEECLPPSDTVFTVEADSAMAADALTKLAWLNVLDDALLNRYNASFVS